MERSYSQPRPRSIGRRRHPSQLRSDKNGSFPVLEVKDSMRYESNMQVSSIQRTRGSYTRENTSANDSRRIVRDISCLGRQIQKLSCVAPMICNSKERERIECDDDVIKPGTFNHYGKVTSSDDICERDSVDGTDILSDRNLGSRRSATSWMYGTEKYTIVDSRSSAVSIMNESLSESKELNETQSTGSCSDGDCFSLKYQYFAKPSTVCRNESTDYSTEGRTDSSSTDDGYDESIGKSRGGATATTATESTLTSFGKRYNTLDGKDRIIRIPSIRLLDSSLLDQSMGCYENNLHTITVTPDTSFIETQGRNDLDHMLIFEDEDEFQGLDQHETLNSTLTDDNTRLLSLRNLASSRSVSQSDKQESEGEEYGGSVHLCTEADTDAAKSIPTTICIDPNNSALEAHSSIDENEIDNPDYLIFTYSPTVSFDYQQELSPIAIETLDKFSGPTESKAQSNIDNMRRESMSSQRRATQDIISIGNIDQARADKHCIQEIIADLKQLEQEEWFHSKPVEHVIRMEDHVDLTVPSLNNISHTTGQSHFPRHQSRGTEVDALKCQHHVRRHSFADVCHGEPHLNSLARRLTPSSSERRTRTIELERPPVSQYFLSTMRTPNIPISRYLDRGKVTSERIVSDSPTDGLFPNRHTRIDQICKSPKQVHLPETQSFQEAILYENSSSTSNIDQQHPSHTEMDWNTSKQHISLSDISPISDNTKQLNKGFFWRSYPSPTP